MTDTEEEMKYIEIHGKLIKGYFLNGLQQALWDMPKVDSAAILEKAEACITMALEKAANPKALSVILANEFMPEQEKEVIQKRGRRKIPTAKEADEILKKAIERW